MFPDSDLGLDLPNNRANTRACFLSKITLFFGLKAVNIESYKTQEYVTTTQKNVEAQELPKKGRYFGTGSPLPSMISHA